MLRRLRVTALLLLSILLFGCAAPSDQSLRNSGPVDPEMALVMMWARGAYRLSVMDPDQLKIVREYPLDRFPADYAIAPNGKVYIPLHQDPGDKEVFLAVLDRNTGKLSKLSYSGWTPHSITITADGTAFILTGMTPRDSDGQIVLVMDTETGQVLGRIALPGTAQRMTPFSQTQVLVPVNGPDNIGGNLYLIDRGLGEPRKLLPDDLHIAPDHVVLRENGLAYMLFGGEIIERGRDRLRPYVSHERQLDPHIAVWDLRSLRLVRTIFLEPPATRNMVMGPDGRLFIPHQAQQGQTPVAKLSVVDPESGDITALPTVNDPSYAQVHGEYLYVVSRGDRLLEVFRLPDLKSKGRVQFPVRPMLSPVSLPRG